MGSSLFEQDYKVLIRLLKEVRERKGVLQSEVAEHLGWTQTMVSKVERRERRIDVIELRQWCICLDIPFRKFVTEFENELKAPGKRNPKG